MDIKDLIKTKRIQKNLTMKELADKVGVSEATISRWESGEISNMKHKGIIALSNALDIEPNIIMGWDDYEEPTTPSPKERVIRLLGEEVVSANTGININEFTDEELNQIADRLLEYARFLGHEKRMDR